jgi:type I restriction enzyme, S subunit
MAGEWPLVEFGDLLLNGTRNGVYKGKAFHGSGVRIVNMGELFAHPRLRNVTMKRVELTDSELQRSSLQAGDLLFARRSLVAEGAGKCSIVMEVNEPTTFESSIIRARPDDTRADSLFLYYLFSSPQGRYLLGTILRQVAVSGITGTDLVQLKVPTPPITDQQAIACILGALDDKIELNRRMNQTLEGLARAIFQSWFVDFDPVRGNARRQGAKTPGRKANTPKTPPASSCPGDFALNPKLAALFPNAFENSELGEIPKGWRMTSLADQITASKGLSYKGQHLCEPGEGLPMHNLNSVYEGGGYKNEGLKWYNGEYRPAHLLNPGDVIVTNTEQGFDHLLIGYAAIVPQRHGPNGLFSHHIFRVQPKATSYLPVWFTYLLLRTQRFHDVVAGHSNGTTVNMLPLDGLQKPRFVLPPKELVEWFARQFLPTQERLERIHDENISLAALRDALLPKLISGELRVRDAERIAGRCL